MQEQKAASTETAQPSAKRRGILRSFNWRRLFDNRRVLWLLAALLTVLLTTTVATLQPLRPNAMVEPETLSATWWLYPIENNAFKRLPVIPGILNDIEILPGDGSTLVSVGRNGLIVRSEDGGRSWKVVPVFSTSSPKLKFFLLKRELSYMFQSLRLKS